MMKNLVHTCLIGLVMAVGTAGATAAEARDTLKSNEKLMPGEALQNGAYKFILQRDGNLVLYNGDKSIWESNTDGVAIRNGVMQADGNFVLYKHDKKPAWSSNTNGKAGSYLMLQADGDVVIFYDPPPVPVWKTNTANR